MFSFERSDPMTERNWLQRAASWLKGKRRTSPLTDDERGGWRILNAPWLQTCAAPTPRQLLEAYADTAYYCANINARAVARTPLRLYVRTRPSEAPTQHPTAELSRKTLAELRRNAPRPLADADGVEELLEHPLLDLLARPCIDSDMSLLSRF